MIIANTLPPARAWNTWSDRPAAMTFLPLGVHVTPLLYSTRHKEATLLPPGEGMRFGHHGMDGRLVGFETRHGGTHIAFRYEKHDPFILQGEWRATSLAEWGLRYWLTLCLSAETGVTVSHHDGACIVRIGYRYVALVSQMAAVQVTAHDSLEAVLDDFNANGYFHTASRGDNAPVIALRFNLEMMRSGRFAAAVADSRDLAIRKARAALAPPPPPSRCRPRPAAMPAHWMPSGTSWRGTRCMMASTIAPIHRSAGSGIWESLPYGTMTRHMPP
ncbi:hypothetical protein RAA17_01590 [Komagataeibacter rhaeticus]|nr:hypothetical protein [Komagataeibacter rhaeticus]